MNANSPSPGEPNPNPAPLAGPPPRPETLLPSPRFLAAWVGAVALLALAAWFLLPRWGWYTRSDEARVERGTIRRVEPDGEVDRLTIACPSGPIELTQERPAGIHAPQAPREGDRVLVRFLEEGEEAQVSLGPKVRDRTLLVILALFFVVLALAGGRRALRAALSLVAAFLLLVVVLVPLTVAGWDPLGVALGLCALIAGGTIVVVAGANRKSLAALLGTLGGVGLALAVGAAGVWWLALTGLSVSFGPHAEQVGYRYWLSEGVGHVDFARLLVAGVVLSCLGAAMDVAISVATAVQEVAAQGHGLSRRRLVASGLAVGRAAVWMTAATLFFVLLGSNLEPFLHRSLQRSALGWARLMSFEEIALLVLRMAAAGLTMTLVAPLTALLAALFLASPRSPSGQRRGAERGFAAWGPRLAALGFLPVVVLGLVLADRLALRSVPRRGAPPAGQGLSEEETLGRVLAVRPPRADQGSGGPSTRGLPHAWQLVACQLLDGPHAGQVVLCNQHVHPNPARNIVVRPGDLATVELEAAGETATWARLRKPALRYRGLLWLVGLLFAGLLALGGWRSARNILGVLALVAAMVGGVFPLLARGAPPLGVMGLFTALAVGGILLLFYGWDRKALAALAGALGALACVVALSAAVSHGLDLTGLYAAGFRWLAELWYHAGLRFDYRAMLLAGLLVAVVGVVIDTSVSIAAGIEELYRAHPGIERRRAFASGLTIGRDVMGVCATTFVFAAIGVRLPVLLAPAAVRLTPAELVNSEAGCAEVARILACGIGLLATAPLTTVCAVALFGRQGPERRRRRSPRRWAAAALGAEGAAALVLAVLVVRHPPHPPVQRVRFDSLPGGDFQAVAREGDALLERRRYARAALLLWRAMDRGIAPPDARAAAARLYLDYVAYANYQERLALPQKVQAQWRPGAGVEADRRWRVHALAELRAALEARPDHFAANLQLGSLLCRQGRPADGIPYLEAAHEARPGHPGALCQLATAYATVGDYERAEALARQAPDQPRARQLLGRLLLRRGEPAEAVQHLEAARQASPDDLDLLCDLAAAYLAAGEAPKARALARQLERTAPGHPRVRQLLEALPAAP
ncbi:MAG: YibE/F family protein [Candidatus Brocadiia bacterium]